MIDFLNALKFKDTREVYDELRQGGALSVFGMNFALKINLTAYIDGTILYVCSDIADAFKVKEGLTEYLGEGVEVFPEREDILLFNRTSAANVHKRLGLVKKLMRGELKVLIATPEALVNYLPLKSRFESGLIYLDRISNREELIRALSASGYTRDIKVESAGAFAVRGDTVDIFPVDSDLPLRVEFFGDEIEKTRYFDEDLQYFDAKGVVIPPATDIIPSADEINYIKNCRSFSDMKHLSPDAVLKKTERAEKVLDDLNSGKTSSAWLSPFIKGSILFDYMPSDSVAVFDEPKQILNKYAKISEQNEGRISNLVKDGELLPEHFSSFVPGKTVFSFSGKKLSFHGINSINPIFAPKKLFHFVSTPITKYFLDIPALYKDVRNWMITGYRVILMAKNDEIAKSVVRELNDNGLPADVTPKSPVYVAPFCIGYGFVLHGEKLAVVGTNELLRKQTKIKKNKKISAILPDVGDYIVHDLHGIGIYRGIVKLPCTDGESDFAEVEYSDGKVYVPAHQMDVLDRYTAGDRQPKLSRIGGKDFAKIKEKVKASIKEMAIDLLALYSERKESKGFRYSPDTMLQKEFEDAFPFEETEDQLEAVQEIKADMESGKIMDRLIAGDVGYGKTEVALRAVFKAVCDGKQCAILAPTTILSEQHYKTALSRLGPFGVNVACVNRFRKPAEIKARLSDLQAGNINVICGTHRLLSKDVIFNDLGLLVLDEEQRFGVEDKEKIKDLKKDIDVLTLSATPIPRTLHLSLTGIRDISILDTPPKNRLPVETAVLEFSDSLLRDAIMREINRGGQAFVLYNKVENIANFAARIQELVPLARVTFAHGQMESAELEKKMAKFYSGESDVLVSTTIIENGIDLPGANTLIVCDADKLGLSQLYQLRGRVGRSDKLAYAYFTYREGSVLTDTAYKRLSAIMDYTALGSGYKIAMRDLEIRGAGNILGREQHGHMEKVGYDMYCRLLKETVEELKGNREIKSDVEIKIDVPASIPENYITDSTERMVTYKRIAAIDDEEEYKILLSEIGRAYGEVPEELINLAKVSMIKNIAAGLGAKVVVNNRKGAGIKFDKNCNVRGILFAATSMQEKCVLSDNPLTVVFDAKTLSRTACNDVILDFLKMAKENV